MLSKNQANGIAEELVNQAQLSRLEGLNGAARPVSWQYRCRELSALEPWQREAVVRQATETVNRTPLFILALGAWIAMLGIIWIYGPSESHQSSPTGLIIVASWAVPLLVRTFLVRREVRKVAAQLHPSRSGFPLIC